VLGRLRGKNLHTWLGGYAGDLARRAVPRRRPAERHLLFAVCDHYEPRWGKASEELGERRVAAWHETYPAIAAPYRDADGRPPRHSFFFPGEEYAPGYLDRLAELCRAGLGEVELHLHHDGDTAANLRATIADYLVKLGGHGHLSRDPDGRRRFAFIHGNWCLANARRDGRWCGVDSEVALLFEEGCYADFTFPSAPDESQPAQVNQIYWPTGDLARRRAYRGGERARVGEVKRDRLLLITGPLALARRERGGLWIENSALDAVARPDATRVRSWVAQDIHVDGRPEWVFVKVHTHGAPEKNAAVLLGEPFRTMHDTLQREFNDGARWRLHYVTAREMYNVAIAAMSGRTGDPNDYRDFAIPPPPIAGGP
jgi:hypothetical protein